MLCYLFEMPSKECKVNGYLIKLDLVTNRDSDRYSVRSDLLFTTRGVRPWYSGTFFNIRQNKVQ